ncbi:CidA/LrgA family protein [Amphibacillus sp. MSJ-3]|uniref:CidA/LrgA family protein n=1 Tax=Amphibacillus sp. MSJ-3 TaxID=2841505 RepID=UPI001C0EBBCD|nr:CidA/LrgA family protein [Amphibacillus sp. MSJ-3]MBU5594038.1 CidA/LrgA family protein [Amphibacillus sp. MSJ-3]
MKKIVIILLQIVLIDIFLLVGIGIKQLIPIPLPATIIGLILLFFALNSKLIKLEWVEQGGQWLMAQLLLFFVPSAVGLMDYQELFSLQGVWLMLIILLSTIIVLGVTGRIVQLFEGSK